MMNWIRVRVDSGVYPRPCGYLESAWLKGLHVTLFAAKRTIRRGLTLALVGVLVFVTPVFAEPTTSTPVPVPTTPAPAPTRTAPTPETAPINVPVDPETLRFREQLAGKQAELDALLAKLDELDRELALAAEAYNQSVDRLSATRQKVADAEVNLENAQSAYALQMEQFGDRADFMYRQDSYSTIEILLDATSLADFIDRVKFLNTIGLADAEVAKALKGQKDLVEQTAEDLKDAARQAEALEFDLKARQIEVMLRIQERQDMLASAQADLLELLEEEATRRQSEEIVFLRQVLAGASDAGITIAAGSPVETAFAYHGIPYLWGGETPSGFDCSGLVLYVFRQHGVELPHYSGSQFLLGTKVSPAALQPGDVVFFGSPIHHVGIYIGGDHYIHAPRTGDFVKISKLSTRRDYAGARRYNWTTRQAPPAGVSNTSDPLLLLGR